MVCGNHGLHLRSGDTVIVQVKKMILAVVGMESETEQPFLAAKIDFAADIQERHRYESAAGNDANCARLLHDEEAARSIIRDLEVHWAGQATRDVG